MRELIRKIFFLFLHEKTYIVGTRGLVKEEYLVIILG